MKFIYTFFLLIIAINASAQNLDIQYDTVCVGDNASLTAMSSMSGDTIVSYLWDFNSDGVYNDANGKNVLFLTSKASSSINLKIITSNREYVRSKEVLCYQPPVALFAVIAGCSSDTTHFVDYSYSTSGLLSEYSWDFNGDGIFESQVRGDASYIYNVSDVYRPVLKVTSEHGCSAEYGSSVRIKQKPELEISAKNFCLGDSTIISNGNILQKDSISKMTWAFGDGFVSNLVKDSIKYLYQANDRYTASVFIEHVNGCQSEASSVIEIYSKPVIDLLFSGDTIMYEGAQLKVSVNCTYDSIRWSTGENKPEILIGKAGTYSLMVANQQCIARKSFQVVVNSLKNIQSPALESNIITPNGDGINDKLNFLKLSSYPICSISVYNSRGVKIYSNSNFQNNWDMEVDGNVLKTGSYYYIIEFGSKKSTGNFNILK